MKQLIITILLFFPIYLFPQSEDYSIDTIQVQSAVLKEARSIIIYKPKQISTSDSVKFIYLLDGEYSDYRYQKLNEHFKDTISTLIGVGIINTDRRRDMLYVYGADNFLDFITAELIPYVEKEYDVKERILFGHSFGGGFTLYAVINKPGFFDCYIASSPTPIMKLIDRAAYQQIDNAIKRKIILYISFGSKDMGQVRKWSLKLRDNLSGLSLNRFCWRFSIFEGYNHNNSDIPALLNGLTGWYD
jgi:predicted alpha/beta superfamily hydrolase